jgi:hypothetical protein
MMKAEPCAEAKCNFASQSSTFSASKLFASLSCTADANDDDDEAATLLLEAEMREDDEDDDDNIVDSGIDVENTGATRCKFAELWPIFSADKSHLFVVAAAADDDDDDDVAADDNDDDDDDDDEEGDNFSFLLLSPDIWFGVDVE